MAPRLNESARDVAWETIENLTRCYVALSRANAPRPELLRYLDRIQNVSTIYEIPLTPQIRAAILARATEELDRA